MLCNRHCDDGRTFGHLGGDIAVVPGWLHSESYQAMPQVFLPSNDSLEMPPLLPCQILCPLPTPATLRQWLEAEVSESEKRQSSAHTKVKN